MRQHHVAGEKAFVDYSGERIAIVDSATGEIYEAEIFVGVLGALNLTYAEPTWTQQLPDRIGAHVRMFRFFGGVPKLLVPRQSEERRQQGFVLCSRDQPNPWRDGGALFGGHPSSAAPQAAKRQRSRPASDSRRPISSDDYAHRLSSPSPNATRRGLDKQK